jgi:predicted ATPase
MQDLPRGTVTLLFTDIEGSTRLMHELGGRYAEVLAEHRRLLREAFGRHGGVEVDTQGDAFFYAFARATDAVAAAADAQAALAVGPVRVRMGVHTGEPLVTDEGYVGVDVHRAARIISAGHGGQVLLSKETKELVDTPVLDLGEHRLKDFDDAVWIFQLGSRRFPPLKTLSNTNLPRPASSFMGREHEVAEVTALFRDGARLVTLTGAGGSGKTRLAIEAASELVPEHRNGVFWVGLASLGDATLVMQTVAETLGAKEELSHHVAEREMLLLVDNLEHVIDAAPELASLVEACPHLRLLVTSRELLRVRGEVEYSVPPLSNPEAVELFSARSGVAPDETVADLCHRLDNLPLAVELAAARTNVLSPRQMLERLASRLDALKGGRDAEARQQTLRATIDWSHELLRVDEQQLFARLAVFSGGCTLEGAEAVADADLDVLQALVDKSLVRHSGERFWMLETIREYALARLEESEQEPSERRRLAEWVLALAQEASTQLVGGTEPVGWLERIDDERDNIRSTLEWAFRTGEDELGLELAAALNRFWSRRAPAEGLAWLERGLRHSDLAPSVKANALNAAGGAAWFAGDHEQALRFFEEGLAVYRVLNDRRGIGVMLNRLGPPLAAAGRHGESERSVREAMAIHRELGNHAELALSLHILGGAAAERGDWSGARALLEESVDVCRDVGERWQLAWDLHNLAELALRRDDVARASSLGCEALAAAWEIRDDVAVLISLGILSATAAKRGDAHRAGALWGAAEQLDDDLGGTIWRTSRSEFEDMIGGRTPDFEVAVDDGRRLALNDAVAFALAPEGDSRARYG